MELAPTQRHATRRSDAPRTASDDEAALTRGASLGVTSTRQGAVVLSRALGESYFLLQVRVAREYARMPRKLV